MQCQLSLGLSSESSRAAHCSSLMSSANASASAGGLRRLHMASGSGRAADLKCAQSSSKQRWWNIQACRRLLS